MVITEFDAGDSEATLHAMAGAILEYRCALRVLGRAVDLARVDAPVALIGPGLGWRSRPTPEPLNIETPNKREYARHSDRLGPDGNVLDGRR